MSGTTTTPSLKVVARQLEKLQSEIEQIKAEQNKQPLRHPPASGGGMGTVIKIFEVQSAATGDGIYNCYEQTLDATEWEDTAGNPKFDDKDTTEVEILNLGEFDPRSGYTPALAKYDFIAAWKKKDDEDESRWVGIPIISGSMVRGAITTEASPASDHITCNLYNPTPVEITSGLGSGIEVYCRITGGSALNVAIPYLPDNTPITVYCIQGKWWCDTNFQTIDTSKGLEISNNKLAVKLDTTEMQFESGKISTKLYECP